MARAAKVISIVNLALLPVIVIISIVAIAFLGTSASSKFSTVGPSVGGIILPF